MEFTSTNSPSLDGADGNVTLDFSSSPDRGQGSAHCPDRHLQLSQSYKTSLISTLWHQCQLLAGLLDQTGIAYHRVLSEQALALFVFLINHDICECLTSKELTPSSLTLLSENLLSVQSRLIVSMDSLVRHAFENQKQNKKRTNVIAQVMGKHHLWKNCAKTRFEEVICPILETTLVNQEVNTDNEIS